MKGSLPANLLKEKLPRFLQKCTQAFESDRRYRNDMRYLRVWLELVAHGLFCSFLLTSEFFISLK